MADKQSKPTTPANKEPSNQQNPTGPGTNPEECTKKCGCEPEPEKGISIKGLVDECTKKCGCPVDEPPPPPGTPAEKAKPKPRPPRIPKPPADPTAPPPEPESPNLPKEPYRQEKWGRRHLEHLMCSDELKKPCCLEQRYCADGWVTDWVDVKSNYMRHPEPMQSIQQSSYTVNPTTPPEVDALILGRIRQWGLGPSFLYHYHGPSPSAPEPLSTYQATFNDYDSEKSHIRPLNCQPRNYLKELMMNYDCPMCDIKNSDCPDCKSQKYKTLSPYDGWDCPEIFKKNGPVHPYYAPN